MFGSVFSKRVLTTDAAPGIIVTIIRNKTRGKERNVFMTETNEELLLRAKRALANGEFSRADAFCEVILDADPNCAEAYLYKLLAELSLSSREALAEYRHFYDKSENYKKAFRLGDRALRDELLAPLNATFALLEEQKRETTYLSAEKALAEAKLPAACEAAEKLFRSLGDYRDSLARAEACRKRAEEIARAMKQKAEEEAAQRAAKKKARLRLALYFVGAFFAAVLIFLAVYFFIVRTAVPNGMCEDALDLIEEGRYEDALLLLDEAREKALFGSTHEKIDAATLEIDKRKAILAFGEALDAEAKQDGIDVMNAGFRAAAERLLDLGVPLEITYLSDGGTLYRDDSPLDVTVFFYQGGESLPEVLTAKKAGYKFSHFALASESSGYRADDATYAVTLCAKYDKYGYSITYDLGGGTVKGNPDGYGVDSATFTLKAPTRVGYTFLGWTGTDIDTPTLTVTVEEGSYGDRSYKAHFKANEYTLTLDPNGGRVTVDRVTVAYDEKLSLPTPVRDGYTFLGWMYLDTAVGDGKWQIEKNVSLKAKWAANAYDITYELGGVPASNPNVACYTPLLHVALETPTGSGAYFLGWYEDAEFTRRVEEIPLGSFGDKTFYAKWELISFTVTYDMNGGSMAEALTQTYTVLDFPVKLPAPTLDGYGFYYWAKDEEDGVPLKEFTEFVDMTLVANYLPNDTQVMMLYGGGREGRWCCAQYSGNATVLKFPKYHMLTYGKENPYIVEISMNGSRKPLEELSISDEVRMLSLNSTDRAHRVYENGKYIASRGNPYHYLYGKADANLPLTVIHEETRVIGKFAFSNDTSLESIVIPASVVEIGLFAFWGCESLKTVYNLSALSIQQGSTDNGYVAHYADAVHTSLDGKKDE